MGFFRRKEKRELEQEAVTQQTATVPEIDDVLLRALLTGEEIDEDKALSIPALAGAVAFIADTVAALPIKLYRDSPQEQSAEELTDDSRLSLLNDDGHDLMNAYEVKRAVVRDMLLQGAGYMHIQRSMNAVLGLRYVDRRSVAVTMNSDPIFKEAYLYVGGKKYYPWDFVILTRNSRNGVTGVGLLKQINSLLATVRNEMVYEGNIAKTGGNKKGFLQSEKKLTEPAMTALKTAWRELYSTNGDNMMILNDGIKYQQAASTSVEMQLNEHKQTNSSWIDMCCGLNTDVISGRANTDGYMSAVRTSVLPVVEAFQAALNKSLLMETEKKVLYFVLDTTELLKSDTVSRFNAYAVGLQNNFLRIDEVRYKENLPPIGFNYIKLGLQDVLLDPETGEIYTPNTNQMVNVGSVKGLTAGGNGGIIEERARHYIRGDRGRFNGSYSDGNDGGNGVNKSVGSAIIKAGGSDVTISSINNPIEQTHTGKGNPNAVLTFDVPLNNRQQELLDKLPVYDSRVIVSRDTVNMADLSALTAKTGDEFAMFTKGNERLIIRGNSSTVNIHISDAKKLAAQGYRWSGHTHPGTGINVLMPSGGDKTILMCFEQEISVIYNSKGNFATFGKE